MHRLITSFEACRDLQRDSRDACDLGNVNWVICMRLQDPLLARELAYVGQILGVLTVRWAPGNSDKKRIQTYIGKYSLAIISLHKDILPMVHNISPFLQQQSHYHFMACGTCLF